MAYATVDSPLGELLLAGHPAGLVRVAYPLNDFDAVLARARPARVAAGARGARRGWTASRRELDEYFEGRRREFDLPLDLSLTRGFSRRVLEATARIGFGEQADLRARWRGRRAARVRCARPATRWARNPMPVVVPCHRVLRSGGGLGGYTGGLDKKRVPAASSRAT